MSGVFLSYARADRAVAYQITQGLRALGVDVWWDEDMSSVDWNEELARQIGQLSAVAVLWSETSVTRRAVKDEARLGHEYEKLVNILLGPVQPPYPYEGINGLPIDGWTGQAPHRGWALIVKRIEDLLVAGGHVAAGSVTGALQQRLKQFQDCRTTIEAATEQDGVAQAAATEAAAALVEAKAALAAAEDQYRKIIAGGFGPALVKTAQQESDEARAAKTAAETAAGAARATAVEAAKRLRAAKGAIVALEEEISTPSRLELGAPGTARQTKPPGLQARATPAIAPKPSPVTPAKSGRAMTATLAVGIATIVVAAGALALASWTDLQAGASPPPFIAAAPAAFTPEEAAAFSMKGVWRPVDSETPCRGQILAPGFIEMRLEGQTLSMHAKDTTPQESAISPLKAGGWLALGDGLWRVKDGKLQVVEPATPDADPAEYLKCE